jgi:hypothetical protein
MPFPNALTGFIDHDNLACMISITSFAIFTNADLQATPIREIIAQFFNPFDTKICQKICRKI